MYTNWVLWEGAHRGVLFLVAAVILWIATYYTYLRFDIQRFFEKRKAHRWSVDMERKVVTSGPKPVQ
jgi:hypothetical protein